MDRHPKPAPTPLEPMSPGSLPRLFVTHDDTCPRWEGSECNCDADIRVVSEGSAPYYIDADGNLSTKPHVRVVG